MINRLIFTGLKTIYSHIVSRPDRKHFIYMETILILLRPLKINILASNLLTSWISLHVEKKTMQKCYRNHTLKAYGHPCMIEQRQFATSVYLFHERITRVCVVETVHWPLNYIINNDYQFHTQAIIIGAVGSLIDNSDFFWISDGLKAYPLVWIWWNNVEVY